jgi:hypothetical protein
MPEISLRKEKEVGSENLEGRLVSGTALGDPFNNREIPT